MIDFLWGIFSFIFSFFGKGWEVITWLVTVVGGWLGFSPGFSVFISIILWLLFALFTIAVLGLLCDGFRRAIFPSTHEQIDDVEKELRYAREKQDSEHIDILNEKLNKLQKRRDEEYKRDAASREAYMQLQKDVAQRKSELRPGLIGSIFSPNALSEKLAKARKNHDYVSEQALSELMNEKSWELKSISNKLDEERKSAEPNSYEMQRLYRRFEKKSSMKID